MKSFLIPSFTYILIAFPPMGAFADFLSVTNTSVGPLKSVTACSVENLKSLLPGHTIFAKEEKAKALRMPVTPIWVAKDKILQMIIMPQEKDRYRIDHIIVKSPKVDTFFKLRVGDTFLKARQYLNLEKCVSTKRFQIDSHIACPALLSPNIWYGFNGSWPKEYGDRPPNVDIVPTQVLAQWKIYEVIWFPQA